MVGTASGWRLAISQSNRTVDEAGPLVFVGGAGDFSDDGMIVHPEDFDAQIIGALANVVADLGQRGCGLADVFRLKAFYQSDGSRDAWGLLAALHRAFDLDPAPAISLQPMPLQPFAGQTVQLQAIAAEGWRDNADLRVIEAPVPDRVGYLFDRPRHTVGLRAGELIVVPGRTAMDDQGEPLALGRGVEQTDIIMDGIEATLAELGASYQDAIKMESYYFGATMDEWAPMSARRAEYFREPAAPSTSVPCHALYPEGSITMIEALAMRDHWNGFDKYIPREDRWPERVWDWPIEMPYRQGMGLRDMIWTGGQVPFEEAMNQGNAVHVDDPLEQARFTMGYVNGIVEAFGKSTRDYALLVCYFASDGSQAATEAFVGAIADTIDGELPPMTLVPQPKMHSDDITVEIWGVARG